MGRLALGEYCCEFALLVSFHEAAVSPHCPMKRLSLSHLVFFGMASLLLHLHAADNPITAALEMKSETFDYDPGWEGFNNHILEGKGAPVVKQDFGYSAKTHFAGK